MNQKILLEFEAKNIENNLLDICYLMGKPQYLLNNINRMNQCVRSAGLNKYGFLTSSHSSCHLFFCPLCSKMKQKKEYAMMSGIVNLMKSNGEDYDVASICLTIPKFLPLYLSKNSKLLNNHFTKLIKCIEKLNNNKIAGYSYYKHISIKDSTGYNAYHNFIGIHAHALIFFNKKDDIKSHMNSNDINVFWNNINYSTFGETLHSYCEFKPLSSIPSIASYNINTYNTEDLGNKNYAHKFNGLLDNIKKIRMRSYSKLISNLRTQSNAIYKQSKKLAASTP